MDNLLINSSISSNKHFILTNPNKGRTLFSTNPPYVIRNTYTMVVRVLGRKAPYKRIRTFFPPEAAAGPRKNPTERDHSALQSCVWISGFCFSPPSPFLPLIRSIFSDRLITYIAAAALPRPTPCQELAPYPPAPCRSLIAAATHFATLVECQDGDCSE